MEKILGFGMMRLPMNGENVDIKETQKMVDLCMMEGFNYFDTAHGYIQGKSEKAVKECISNKYPRESYILTNKLTGDYFKTEEDIEPLFVEQLNACGVDYFDYYLMHSQDKKHYEHFKKCHAYEKAYSFKKDGRIKHFGISFHDTADVLETILKEHDEIEVVQIQFNYIDYNSPSVQSKEVYEVCRKYGKKIIVMEPVKGGGLANLPINAKKILDELKNGTNASFAIRFAASFDGVYKVLSGMSSLEQTKDNLSYMKDFKPINDKEMEAINKVVDELNKIGGIPCTGCRYCIDNCPQGIKIPDLFSCYNAKKVFNDWNSSMYYNIHTREGSKPNECLKCGACENACPQHLKIREYLEEVSKTFEK